MFTGLIESVGRLDDIRQRRNYRILHIQTALPLDEIRIGDSVACDGACLTVVDKSASALVVEASQETLERTILGHYRVGRQVNLERALHVGGRLGGHFVTGHVDTVGTVHDITMAGDSTILTVRFDRRFHPWVVEKGSIGLNGVSLTVNNCRADIASVNLIPHTIEQTNLKELRRGSGVNIEFDLIGKYVARSINNSNREILTIERLQEYGW